ncbi:DUF2316 family protein [Lactiplantibacillus modestisalitolerans]|uniref:DUF2316 family protein n=1 Tax=Lactiplantibacillus modestisalitolerans TaxID=1457219 RepID=A0ABV5WU75_9LACO|nr:DUF2316 family protein [Lactiplantibacillus modestisalitolerans]
MPITRVNETSTKDELWANFKLTGLSLDRVAQDLQTTAMHVEDVLNMNVRHVEEPWILRNYLNAHLDDQGKTPVAYTRLTGATSDYWFLNQQRIRRGMLG